MQNIWKYISNLGIKEKPGELRQKSIVMTNQLNFVILIIMGLLFLTTFITLQFMHEDMSYGTLRIPVLLMVSFLNLVAARFGLTQLSRLISYFSSTRRLPAWPYFDRLCGRGKLYLLSLFCDSCINNSTGVTESPR